jgi:protein ImuB
VTPDISRKGQPFSLPSPEPEATASQAQGRRYLALWFPLLSTDRVRIGRQKSRLARQGENGRLERRSDWPLVLCANQGGTPRIKALDRKAAAAGLTIGMTLAAARAYTTSLDIEDSDTDADARLLGALAGLCEVFTPLVAHSKADGVMLDVSGCTHLFGGEEALLQRAIRRIARLGIETRACMATTPDTARALAIFGQGGCVPAGGEEAAVRPLPVTALDMEAKTTVALSRAGLRTIGDLANRPSRVLTARFGPALTIQLGRILGREDIRITSIRPAPACMAERHFPEPLGHMDSIMPVLARLSRDMAAALERQGTGGRLFEAAFFRSDGAVRRLMVETMQPLRDPVMLLRLITLKMDALADPLDPGFGFDAVRLSALRLEDRPQHQAEIEGRGVEEDTAEALIDRLIARFGRTAVLRLVERDTHDPVRASACLSFLTGASGAEISEPKPGEPPLRPLTLFEPPQPVEAMAEVPDGPPLQFRWRRVLHAVTRAEGPERIAPEWWCARQNAAMRDYYRIEDQEGRRFWLFREGLYGDPVGPPRWFMHGLFA